LKDRGFFLDRPAIGPFVDAGPIHLSATPARYEKAAPLPGADNDYVYGTLLGLSPEEMERLENERVI
jgi:crotonobetainyl-CoA:carnitine CoA-transferase CaiB-like acyl-CoA transferase